MCTVDGALRKKKAVADVQKGKDLKPAGTELFA